MASDAFKFSGQGAINYDQYLGPVLFEPAAVELVSRLTPSSEKIFSVLEIACGTGRVTRHLRYHFKQAQQFVASDFNADMLQVAKDKLQDDSIEFKLEDAQNLSFPDNSFDLVVFQFGLMFLQDKKKGLSEAFRVLKPGGRFVFSTWDKTEHAPLLNLIFNETVLPFFKEADYQRLLVPFSLSDPSTLLAWMEEVNFKDTEATNVKFKSGAPAAIDVVNGFFTKHSIGQEVFNIDKAAFNEIASTMEQKIINQFGSTNLSFELSAFFITGRIDW